MAPKPLSKFAPRPNFRFGVTALTDLPEIRRYIGEVVVLWAYLETQLGRALSKLFGTDGQVGIAVYLAIQSPSAQRDALLAAARKSLDADELRLFRALVALAKELGTERNKIAHWLWGTCIETPGAGLLMDPRLLLPVSAAVDRSPAADPFPSGPSHDDIMVYSVDDLREIADRMKTVRGYFVRFWDIRDYHTPEERPALLDELFAEPAIDRVAKQTSKKNG